jgi:hypothetical protein
LLPFSPATFVFSSAFQKPKRDEVTGGWRKLHEEEDMGRACGTNGEKRNIYIYIYIGYWWESQKERDQ